MGLGMRGLSCLVSAGDKALDATLALGAWKQNFAVTGQAAHANISADAYDAPGITATGMWLAHLYYIADGERHWSRHSLSPVPDAASLLGVRPTTTCQRATAAARR